MSRKSKDSYYSFIPNTINRRMNAKLSSLGNNLKFISIEDNELNKSSEEELKNNDRFNIGRRDIIATNFFDSFVETYNNNAKTNRNLKRAFFVMFMIFLSITIVTPIIIVILACFKKNFGTNEIITALISSAATIVTSIIIIPKIMVQHLFSSEETKVSVDLVSKLIETDKNTRKIHESNKDVYNDNNGQV